MSRIDPFAVCGTAHAFMNRRTALEETVELLDIAAHREGDRLVLTLTVRSEDKAPRVNIHHSATPTGGYPFLDSKYEVWVLPGRPVRVELDAAGRDGPWHIVFQDGDAFVDRTVGA